MRQHSVSGGTAPPPGIDPADRALLSGLFQAGIAAADPFRILQGHLPTPPRGRLVVVGAGKGVAQLAAAF